eukprot:scaffold1391_cov123-Cylindrotheca_fusiformis.AAC.8
MDVKPASMDRNTILGPTRSSIVGKRVDLGEYIIEQKGGSTPDASRFVPLIHLLCQAETENNLASSAQQKASIFCFGCPLDVWSVVKTFLFLTPMTLKKTKRQLRKEC